MGELALQGRDKLTFVVDAADRELRPLGRAAGGRVHRQAGQGHPAGGGRAAGRPGRPTATIGCSCTCATPTSPTRTSTSGWRRWPGPITRRSPSTCDGAADLGRIFFFAEFATAVAGWVLGINPFDQPNVQEAKDNTAKVLEGGDLPDGRTPRRPRGAARRGGAAALRGDPRLHGARRTRSTPRWPSCAARSATRRRPPPRSGTARATCTPPGSSTRAARPPGCSWSSCTTAAEDVEIPGAGYTFEHLKNAQAIGDLQTLRDHGLHGRAGATRGRRRGGGARTHRDA